MDQNFAFSMLKVHRLEKSKLPPVVCGWDKSQLWNFDKSGPKLQISSSFKVRPKSCAKYFLLEPLLFAYMHAMHRIYVEAAKLNVAVITGLAARHVGGR